jgi:hypothetical protein
MSLVSGRRSETAVQVKQLLLLMSGLNKRLENGK